MVETKKRKPLQLSYSRRTILLSTGGALGLLALGAVGSAHSETRLVRPPGGQDERDFFSKCIKCNRCISVCPENSIVPAQLKDGFFNMRTPVMSFQQGYCDFCKKCIEVCPTGALADFAEETCKIGVAHLTDSCIALRTAGCTKCHEECPYDAIGLDAKGSPVIDEEPCTGCGMCVKVCPAHTLQSFATGAERGIVVRPVGEKS